MATTDKILSTKLIISNRAVRLDEARRISMREAILKIHETFKGRERKAIVHGRAVECRGYKNEGAVLGIHLIAYIPEDKIGIVPHTQDELDLLSPPEDADFLDGELIALVTDDDLIVCRLGLWESMLSAYVQDLGPKAGIDAEDASFGFKNRTDVDKLKMIKDDGVREIRFEGVASKDAVDHVAKDGSIMDAVTASVMQNVRAFTFAERKTPPPVSDNLKVEVFLKFDGRSGTQIDQEELQDIATEVASNEDDFQIVTRSGKRITPDEVFLTKKVTLQRYGKSVTFNDVFEEMQAYYEELTSPGE
ncbi:hypothetical protein J2767_002329 [Agrobacterium tumefaciens]|uniref:hypothetical protein n=1 Tax=Agrobacterium tumefaciens TaxID=358 RepID=UPI0013AEAE53|nr:hypothetical protein [Agrobacterium tumefaciens]MBP2571160.1 hypothetical protein [Agrobacterium tumefaciens]